MATITWDAWYDDVLPRAGGCPPNVAKMQIREAAIEFCKLSRSWRYLGLTPIDAVATQQRYAIGTGATVGTLPVKTVVAHIFQVNWNGKNIDVRAPKAFKALSDTWYSDAGEPTDYTLFTEGELALWRIPAANAAGAIVVPEVALAPSQDADGVDSSIWEKYRTTIAMGALGLIHMIDGEPYTDMQLGASELARFRAAAGSADVRAASARGHARLRTQTIPRG